jgi:hypothetical protein
MQHLNFDYMKFLHFYMKILGNYVEYLRKGPFLPLREVQVQ